MKNPFGVALFSLTLIYFLYGAYIVWLKPKQYMGHIHARREKLKSQFPFFPDWLIGFIFFYENPHLLIWWARIMTSIAAVFSVLGLIAAFHGPF